jgi:hypothetical protein
MSDNHVVGFKSKTCFLIKLFEDKNEYLGFEM